MNPWTLGNTLKWPPSWVVGEKQSSQDDWSRKFDTSPSHILEHGSTSGTHGNYGSLFSSSRCWRRNRKLPGRFWSSFWLWLGPQDFRRWIGERTWTERSRGYLGVIIIWESPGWSMALLTRNGDLKEFFLEEPRIRIRGQLWTSDIFILATWHWSESWTSLCRLTNLYMIWACIERESVSNVSESLYTDSCICPFSKTSTVQFFVKVRSQWNCWVSILTSHCSFPFQWFCLTVSFGKALPWIPS